MAEVFICTKVEQKMLSLNIYGINTYEHTGHTGINFFRCKLFWHVSYFACFRSGISIVIFTQLVTGISTYLYQC